MVCSTCASFLFFSAPSLSDSSFVDERVRGKKYARLSVLESQGQRGVQLQSQQYGRRERCQSVLLIFFYDRPENSKSTCYLWLVVASSGNR
jgi:hypothetical protein